MKRRWWWMTVAVSALQVSGCEDARQREGDDACQHFCDCLNEDIPAATCLANCQDAGLTTACTICIAGMSCDEVNQTDIGDREFGVCASDCQGGSNDPCQHFCDCLNEDIPAETCLADCQGAGLTTACTNCVAGMSCDEVNQTDIGDGEFGVCAQACP